MNYLYLAGIILIPALFIYAGEIPQNQSTVNDAYADSVLEQRYGAENITINGTFVERILGYPDQLYRLAGIKNQGLLIVNITSRKWMEVVGFIPSRGNYEITAIAQWHEYLYLLQENPLELLIFNMLIPFEPIILNKIKLPVFNQEMEKFTIQIDDSILKVISERKSSRQAIVSFELKNNPAKPELLYKLNLPNLQK